MKKRFDMKYRLILILVVISCIILFSSLVSASDVLVWQGQYFTGTTFNVGTYNFNFSVYDTLTGGDICYSNTTTLTTGNFGEWKTEQNGVNSACNNVSKDYYLNININGADQSPRRRIVVWDSLRKNVDETTLGDIRGTRIEAEYIKVNGRYYENNHIWASKLSAAEKLANTTLISAQEVALKLITTTTTTTGESIESKIIKLQQAGEQAKTMIISELEIAKAKILEAKELAILNGETSAEHEAIVEDERLKAAALNLTAQEQIIIVEQALNDSINEVIANDDGIRFCLSNGTNCQNNPTFNNVNATNGFFSYLGSLVNRITKLFVQDIDASGNITATYFIGDGSLLTGISSSSTDLTNYALKNQSETFAGNIITTQTGFFNYLGSLVNRITKLWVQEIDIEKSIKIGYTAQGVCDASTEGTIIYDNNGDKREFYGCRQKSVGTYEWVKLS